MLCQTIHPRRILGFRVVTSQNTQVTNNAWVALQDCKSNAKKNRDAYREIDAFALDLAPPEQLLDLGDHGASQIRLTDTEESLSRVPYVALSYCWGDPNQPPIRTQKDSEKERRNGIPFTDLSKVYQDTVTVARHLRFRYLWIDSLCIIQDDEDDWNAESLRTGSIHSKATLTLVPSCAPSVHDAFLKGRDPLPPEPVRIPFSSSKVNKGLVSLGHGLNKYHKFTLAEHRMAEPVQAREWCLDADVDPVISDMTGFPHSARLIVRGYYLYLRLEHSHDTMSGHSFTIKRADPSQPDLRITPSRQNECMVVDKVKDSFDAANDSHTGLPVIALAVSKWMSIREECDEFHCLLLRSVDAHNTTYMRVGLLGLRFQLPREPDSVVVDFWNGWVRRDLTLV